MQQVSVEAMVRGLLPAEVAVAAMDPADANLDALLAAEQSELARAVDKRKREFAAGRQLARKLLGNLGVADFALRRGERGAPVWPEGIVGSISHTRTAAVVAVGRSSAFASIGVDVEADEPLREELRRLVCTEHERTWLGALPPDAAGWQGKAVFCAKEALYKTQFPLTQAFLGFNAVDIDLDPEAGTFAATFRIAASPIDVGTRWTGKIVRAHGLIATAMHVTS